MCYTTMTNQTMETKKEKLRIFIDRSNIYTGLVTYSLSVETGDITSINKYSQFLFCGLISKFFLIERSCWWTHIFVVPGAS